MLLSLLLWSFFTCLVPAWAAVVHQPFTSGATFLGKRANDTADGLPPPLLANATMSDVDRARALIKSAIAQVSAQNKARVATPARNHYTPYGGSNGNAAVTPKVNIAAAPAFNISEDIQQAAALVAEADAWSDSGNGTTAKRLAKRAGSFWMGSIKHNGAWPFGKNDASFKVFRDVTTYGAKGDGVTDDTAAIRKAVSDGGACGAGCYSSTTKGAIIYFPPGTYLVSGTIETYYGTQFIGDANSRPIIRAAPSFVGLGVISTDKYVDNGGNGVDGNAKEWYINTANFYRQIRNLVIDITATDQGAYVCGLHYQVAQATSLQFVEFRASTASGTTQQAVYAENGSGGFMSDITFNGGAFGIYGGSQQFTAQRLTFNNVKTAVQLIWDWGFTWKSIQVNNCGTGFNLVGTSGVSNTGSVMIVDSSFTNTPNAILTVPASIKTGSGSTGVTLDNVKFSGVTSAVVDTAGKVYLAGNTAPIDTWVQGRIYVGQQQSSALNAPFKTKRLRELTGTNPWGLQKDPYFERAKPQYTTEGAGSFINLKDHCKGDGVTDVTACFQQTLNTYANSKIIYVDAGSYILTDTVTIPPGTRLVGEVWSQLVAYGSNFGDARAPRPMLRVGNKGDKGSVEMQDLIFTVKGPTLGVILVEWNIQANDAGTAGMWDCHARVGGAVGSQLQSSDCPSTATKDSCKAASMLMHVTEQGSGYFENVWWWVADHDLDDPDTKNDNNAMPFTSIYSARGVLIESKVASWYYGTASEHSVYYQYALEGAEKQYMGMIQTEQAYYQPVPKGPNPFPLARGLFPGDPTWSDDSDSDGYGWSLRIQNSSDVQIHGAGLYSWFDNYVQACVDTSNCQKSMVKFSTNGANVRLHNLVTIGGVNMINADGVSITSKDNLAVNFHPYWSQIAVFDPIQNLAKPSCNAAPGPAAADPTLYADPAEEFDGSMYVTLYNGSPYDWILGGGSHSYQITDEEIQGKAWETAWSNIPAGTSLTVPTHFASGSLTSEVDDRAEIFFTLDGTDLSFHVSAHVEEKQLPRWRIDIVYDNLSTKDSPPISKGQTIPLATPFGEDAGRSVIWGLTGSESTGFLSTGPSVAWMSSILDTIGDRKLKYICMPGSHDAGMSTINGHTLSADSSNTQNQLLDIYHQLVRGSRWFDIRPCLGNGGARLLCHYSKVGAFQGANGQSVADVIRDVNNFMNDHPGELVILDINSESGYDSDNGYPRLTDAQWQPFLDDFSKGITKNCNTVPGKLHDATFNDLVPRSGCVVQSIRNVGGTRGPNQVAYGDAFEEYNHYSESDDYGVMAPDQVAKLKANRLLIDEGDPNVKDGFHTFSWTLTWGSGPSAVFGSTQSLAAEAYGGLFGYAYQSFTPFSYPNVLYVDFVGEPNLVDLSGSQDDLFGRTTTDLLNLALAVNLDIAGQNCHVGGGGKLSKRSCAGNGTAAGAVLI